MAAVVVERDGGVAPGDGLAVDLCRDGDVLADGEAKDVLDVGELETVAGPGVENRMIFYLIWGADTYMAVLGETLVTFSRGNSFHLLGSRGLVLPIK